MSDPATGADPHELRESVRDYRNPNTTDTGRDDIRSYWADHGIPNQAAAMLRAATIERAR